MCVKHVYRGSPKKTTNFLLLVLNLKCTHDIESPNRLHCSVIYLIKLIYAHKLFKDKGNYLFSKQWVFVSITISAVEVWIGVTKWLFCCCFLVVLTRIIATKSLQQYSVFHTTVTAKFNQLCFACATWQAVRTVAKVLKVRFFDWKGGWVPLSASFPLFVCKLYPYKRLLREKFIMFTKELVENNFTCIAIYMKTVSVLIYLAFCQSR